MQLSYADQFFTTATVRESTRIDQQECTTMIPWLYIHIWSRVNEYDHNLAFGAEIEMCQAMFYLQRLPHLLVRSTVVDLPFRRVHCVKRHVLVLLLVLLSATCWIFSIQIDLARDVYDLHEYVTYTLSLVDRFFLSVFCFVPKKFLSGEGFSSVKLTVHFNRNPGYLCRQPTHGLTFSHQRQSLYSFMSWLRTFIAAPSPVNPWRRWVNVPMRTFAGHSKWANIKHRCENLRQLLLLHTFTRSLPLSIQRNYRYLRSIAGKVHKIWSEWNSLRKFSEVCDQHWKKEMILRWTLILHWQLKKQKLVAERKKHTVMESMNHNTPFDKK